MDEESSILNQLESSITILEKQILGDDELTEKHTSVVESLANSNTLLATALSGREKVSNVMKRINELEGYLDPTYEEYESSNIATKIEMILAMEPILLEKVKLAEQISELLPVLDKRDVQNVSEMPERIAKLALFHLDKKKSVDEISDNTFKLIQEYNKVIDNISQTFMQWDILVEQIEIARQPKKDIE